MKSKIPNNWQMLRFDKVATIERNSIAPQDIESGMQYVGLEDIDSSGAIIGSHLVNRGDLASSKFKFTNEHVLFGKLRPYLSKTALPSFSGICSTDVLPILPKNGVSRDFLRYFLRHPDIVELATMRSTGANLPRLSPSELCSFEIPLPPFEEQENIVSILDFAEEMQRKRKEAVKLLDVYMQSIFLEMFGDPVTNSKKWTEKPLGLMLDRIDSGWSPKCAAEPAAADKWGVLKVSSVTSCNYRDWENKALFSKDKPKISIEVKKGDLLFSRKNTYDLVAASAYVFDTRPKLMLSDLLFRLKIKDDAINPIFLWRLLNHSGQRKIIQSFAGGAAGSMPNISKEKLKKVSIIVPPKELQEKFEGIVLETNRIKNFMESQLKELDNQFLSLVRKAFAGELNVSKKPTRNWFGINKVIGVVIRSLSEIGSPRGEMVIAKYMYLLQEVFRIPMQIGFEKNKFGPYTNEIKKSLFAGASPKNKFFKVSGSGEQQVFVLGENAPKLFQYKDEWLNSAETHMADLAKTIGKLESAKIELLATVCKIIQDDQVTDLAGIKNKMEQWKPGKYTDAELERVLAFIKKQKWDSILMAA